MQATMPGRASHPHHGPPLDPGVTCALECVRATRASLAEDRLCIETSREAIARSYGLLADRGPRPDVLDAAPPATRSPASPPPRDTTEAAGADALRGRMIDGLQSVLGLIERRLRCAEGTQAREALSALLGDVSALGAVQRRFAEGGPAGGLAGGLAELGAAWQRLAADHGVAVEVEAEPVEVGERQAIALALAANELVTNGLKHASTAAVEGGCASACAAAAGDGASCASPTTGTVWWTARGRTR